MFQHFVTVSTHLHSEWSRKSHTSLHDFLNYLFNTRDSRALYCASEPNAVMEEQDYFEGGVFSPESAV